MSYLQEVVVTDRRTPFTISEEPVGRFDLTHLFRETFAPCRT